MTRKFLILALLMWVTSAWSTQASLVWTYDFPGTPGSGLGSGQTNPQTPNATFGDFTRVGVSQVGTGNVFDSNFWNTTSNIDLTQYEGFTITAAAGYHLDLQSLTFLEMATAGGPTKGRVYLFLNGSTTPYSGLDYNPDPSFTSRTFGFTPTVDADNVTVAEFRFYGWNGGTANASLILSNVAVTFTVVPEATTLGPIILLLGTVCLADQRLRKREPITD